MNLKDQTLSSVTHSGEAAVTDTETRFITAVSIAWLHWPIIIQDQNFHFIIVILDALGQNKTREWTCNQEDGHADTTRPLTTYPFHRMPLETLPHASFLFTRCMDYLWITVMLLSAKLNAKFVQTVTINKQTHLHFGWLEGEYIFSKCLGELLP